MNKIKQIRKGFAIAVYGFILWTGIACQCDNGPAKCQSYHYIKTIELKDSTDTIRKISYPYERFSMSPDSIYAELMIKDDGVTSIIIETDRNRDTIVFSAKSRYYYYDAECDEGYYKDVEIPSVVNHTFAELQINAPRSYMDVINGKDTFHGKPTPCTIYYSLYVK